MKSSSILSIKNLSVSYMETKALTNVTCDISPNQLVGIIGPNGGGKSTFIKAVMGLVTIGEGKIHIMEQPVSKVYKHIAYVPQKNTLDLSFPILIENVVMQGRYPHIPWWGLPRSIDYNKVHEALEKVGMVDFKKRQIGKLSGGQLQRVLLARALAQEATIFFLDEPFAGIDIASENRIMEVLKELKELNKTIFVVHHDLSKIEKYFDTLILLKNELIAYGPKEQVLTASNLKKAYEGSGTLVLDQNQLLVVNKQ